MDLAPTNYRPVPGPRGLDYLRIMNLAATYTNAAIEDLARTHGEIFVFGFGPIRFHWLCGPEALRFVLQDQAEAFTLKRAYSFLQVIGGDNALITSDEPEHLTRRRLVQPAFHGSRLAAWSEHIGARNQAFFGALEPDTPFNFHASIRPHILKLISELLLGDTLQHYPTLLPNIAKMMDFANSPFLAQQFKLSVPPLPWWQFKRARAEVDRVLYEDIRARKQEPPTGDVLGMLLSAADEAGQSLSDTELRDQAVSLVSAGFDTTSAALAWAVYLLLEHPQVLTDLRAELKQAAGPREVLGLPLLDAIVKETLRLYPAAPAGLREASRDVRYKSYLLPKGSLVAYSIYVTQRQEASFEQALSFKPERWFGAKPKPFSYAPFGHGARYCIGAGLANTLIKLTLAELLAKYQLEPLWEGPVRETGNTVQPKGGLPLRVSPLR